MNNFLLPFTGIDSINLAYFIQDLVQEYNRNTRMINTNIHGVYGSFNNIIWNGGRTIDNGINNILQISQVLNSINSHDMICKFVFTNCLLEKKHLLDKYCNQVLDLIAETNNEIVINSPILEDYIRNKYPSIGLTSSITKGLDYDTYKTAIQKDYKNVVVYPRRNILKDIELLNAEDKAKIELMINNDGCGYCKMEQQHYRNESYNNLYGTSNTFVCYQFLPNFKKYKEILAVPLDELLFNNYEYFLDLGISCYKVLGRGALLDRLLIDYLDILFFPGIRNEIYNNSQQFDFFKNL